MPNKRAPGQTPILIPMKDQFKDAIDRAYRAEGIDDRSKFIRIAVREKLQAMGKEVPIEWTLAPGRVRYRIARKKK
jgi:metal-responsive CopG/Arc/MetJ family transcriptional regulator